MTVLQSGWIHFQTDFKSLFLYFSFFSLFSPLTIQNVRNYLVEKKSYNDNLKFDNPDIVAIFGVKTKKTNSFFQVFVIYLATSLATI